MSMLNKILNNLWVLRSIFSSIWFNFRYLPFKQAIKLPILFYKPQFIKCKGRVVISASEVKFGMIQLGKHAVSIYPNSGFVFENNGGVIEFCGRCFIGGGSAISVGESGNLKFGDDFGAKAMAKIVSYIGITFGIKSRLGWDTLIMDTNFHPLYNIEKRSYNRAYGRIEIGDYNWFGNQCFIMHSVVTPQRAIFGARSIVNRGCDFESFAIHGGSPLRVLTRGVMRDYDNDTIKEFS